jgi:hypothetical protein
MCRTLDARTSVGPHRQRRNVSPSIPRGGELGKDVLALADDDGVDAELAQRRRRCGRRVRADGDNRVHDGAQIPDRLLRHAQLGRRASPEQVTGRGRDDGNVRGVAGHRDLNVFPGQAAELSVEDLRVVARLPQERLGITVFERQVRLPAPEVDTAAERPRRVHERELHDARMTGTDAGTFRRAVSHWWSARRPLATLTDGAQPVAAENLRVSLT